MEPLTIRLQEDLKETIQGEADEYGVSVSEYVRELIRKGREYDDLEAELQGRRERIEELEEQLARRSQIEEQVDELALELREHREEPAAPWPVRWVRWWRER